jgi:hypothetical protein
MIKLERMRCARHVAWMGGKVNADSVGKSEEN